MINKYCKQENDVMSGDSPFSKFNTWWRGRPALTRRRSRRRRTSPSGGRWGGASPQSTARGSLLLALSRWWRGTLGRGMSPSPAYLTILHMGPFGSFIFWGRGGARIRRRLLVLSSILAPLLHRICCSHFATFIFFWKKDAFRKCFFSYAYRKYNIFELGNILLNFYLW